MISFGTDFVAGKKRVPRPATGKIAFVIRRFVLNVFLQSTPKAGTVYPKHTMFDLSSTSKH
jgi:hypothetical protein